jgi:tRNA(Ile)-lysidine synthase
MGTVPLETYARFAPEGKLEAVITELQTFDGPVIVACSGGADSVFLAECARLAGINYELAHVHHGLREDADEDAKFVARLAADQSVNFHHLSVNVSHETGSLEAAARDARYGALLTLARQQDSTLMTAHTATDQFETLLMRLGRGTGLTGLSGIPRRSKRDGILLARPLLDWWREDIRSVLSSVGVDWHDDPTNTSDFALRNRVRQRISPAFFSEFERAPTLRSMNLMSEEANLYRALLSQRADRIVETCDDGVVRLSVQKLLDAASSFEDELRTTAVKSLLHELFHRAGLTLDHQLFRDVADDLIEGVDGARAASRLRVEYDATDLIARRTSDPSRPFPPPEPEPLSPVRLTSLVGSSAQIGGWRVDVQQTSGDEIPSDARADSCVEYFDHGSLPDDLCFRLLDRGDYFYNQSGHRRSMWARAKKDGWDQEARKSSVVLASKADVYWLIGGRRSSRALVSTDTSDVLVIRVQRTD